MKVKVESIRIKNEWDYQKGKLLLEWNGLDGSAINHYQRDYLEKEITKFLWDNIKKQFPDIEKFCTERRGGFNKPESRNHNTPIISIHGSFYMQLVGQNNRNEWIWETIELEPYRFYFNEDGYFKRLVIDAINKLITSGTNEKDDFKELVSALNKIPTKQKLITINKRNGNVGLIETLETIL